jgi:hypothetical protein
MADAMAEIAAPRRREAHPPRRSHNGHHPDCPYPLAKPDGCGICAGIRKGGIENPTEEGDR